MTALRPLLFTLLLLPGLSAAPSAARAAESYDNCTGFITTLPATITTQGTWCLNQNLSTAITNGGAITIATDNVTIDCNDFKLDGLAAGDSSAAYGIFAASRLNATVRRCAVRGFYRGISLTGGGHLLEDNHLDQNMYMGIYVSGDNNRVQRNRIYDTGGRPGFSYTYGIYGTADLIDNTVAGVFATATNTYPRGIYVLGAGSEARGNRVRGLVVAGSGSATGIYTNSNGARIDGNHVSAGYPIAGYGIYGGGTNTFCTNNTVSYIATAYHSCDHNAHNLPGT